MKKRADQKIFGTIAADELIGRSSELDRITAHAQSGRGGLAVLATPGAGASELLRQAYDRLFLDQREVIPFYFAISESDRGPRDAAQRFLHELLSQTVAFRRGNASILGASPELSELAQLAAPVDGHWIDRMIESARGDADCDDDRAYVRSLLSAPVRANAHGARIFVMIDDLDRCASMSGGETFFDELADIYGRSDIAFVFAGARRFLFGATAAETLSLEPLGFDSACELAVSLAERFGVGLNDQTRDLIAVQLGGSPSQMTSLFAAAAARGENFDNFFAVERIYGDEIFGGNLGRSVDAVLERIVPVGIRANAMSLLAENLDSGDGTTPLAYWRKHLGLEGDEFHRTMEHLSINEFISLSSGTVFAEPANLVLSDYLSGHSRLAGTAKTRALVVGEALTEYLKRAPHLLARLYRRNSALGLRSLLGAFNCQKVAAASIDYAKFKADLKGLSDVEIETALDNASDTIALPQIVYTAPTSAFYSKIGELIEDERSTVALGFVEAGYRDETIWIAAEIDSKLEVAADLTEFWCDRLEMAAVTCGFASYTIWLVSPEGFSDDALNILNSRGAYGSSRKQVELLTRVLTGHEIEAPATAADEYEIIVPMGDDTEMIAAHTVEDIAKRHDLPAKTINQIKTALVEACINATEHSLSPDRRIYQKFAIDSEKITIAVANRGLRLLDKTVREITPDEGRRGWGLKLMKGLMDEVKIEQSDDGTRVTMVKYLKTAK